MLSKTPILLVMVVPISISMGMPAVLGMFLILGPNAVAIWYCTILYNLIQKLALSNN